MSLERRRRCASMHSDHKENDKGPQARSLVLSRRRSAQAAAASAHLPAAAECGGACVIAAGAADAAGADGVLVAQRLWEERKAEELVADGIGKFLARRHLAKAVAGHEDLHLCQHLEDDGDADLKLKDVIADICTGYADGGDHRLDRVGHDGLIRDGKQHVAVDGHHAAADVFPAGCVGKEDVNRYVDLSAHAGEAGAVAQALDGEVADDAFGGGGAAAFKRDRHVGLGVLHVAGVAAGGGGDEAIALQGDALFAELFLIPAACGLENLVG